MTPPDAAPAPMEGHGGYNRNSRVQAAGLAPAIDWFAEAAAAVPLDPSGAAITIADYGASEGRNSLAPIAAALAALRLRIGPDRAVSVIHTDLPDNDWTALFRAVAAPGGYLAPQVYPSAVGRSFYDQILPTASVTLGWSSWAVQWLSRTPSPIPDQVQVAFTADPAARAAYAAQARADWRAFLAARAAELVPGGRVVVLTMALDAAGDFGYGPILAAMYAALLACVREGLVLPDEKDRMAIPTFGRSAADIAAPFAAGPFAGLTLARTEVFAGEDRIWAGYRATRDAAAYAAQWAGFSRASVFPTLAAAIDGPDAVSRRAAFTERMTADLAARLAAAPQEMNIPLVRIECAKAAS